MEKNKLTLEDLKLTSFLTEIDNSKLVKVQGGEGAYGANTEALCDGTEDCGSDDCGYSESGCTCLDACGDQSYNNDDCQGVSVLCDDGDTQTLQSDECDTRDTSEGCQ